MITMRDEEYEALRNWAIVGAEESEEEGALAQMCKSIEAKNNVQRYTLLVRYQPLPEKGTPSIMGTSVIAGDTIVIQQRRPVTREDVLQRLEGLTYLQPNVFVTRDPNGAVGWYQLDAYPFG